MSAGREGAGRIIAVVVAHDSAHALPECLAALAAQSVPAIVVDNASGDGSAKVAEAHGARVLRGDGNEGFGRGMNRGIRAAAGAEFCLLMNPDIVLEPGAAAALLDAAGRYPDAALLAPRLVEPDGRVFFQSRSLLAPPHLNRGKRRVPEGDACAPFLSGACLLARREAVLALGGFDEAIFLFYEDDDLCRRLRDAGHALVHVHGAEARHGRGRSSAPRPGRVYASRWHQAWSRGHVAAKHGLPPQGRGGEAVSALKAAWAWARRDPASLERHRGSLDGARAFRRGASAFDAGGRPAAVPAGPPPRDAAPAGEAAR